MATRSLLDRFMSSYGIGITFGALGAMSWHHIHRYQFHRIYLQLEEDYRENGRPLHLKRELRAKWAEMRHKELMQQLKFCGYMLSVASVMAIIIRISRKTFRKIPSPTKEIVPPISDTMAAFVSGALLIDGPYLLFDYWEGKKITKWREFGEKSKDLVNKQNIL
ncbi:hypothetical protein Mgra_00001975 [Meloidogyne graminicola]|uniref:Uncharacterized protein n=1 Tax=Meloidogyne graminicola TaxID=189291 RepID=A0A8S9ZYA1_9BILA|nr:hypothetical protein Mgra_00001975 [Meloidogyne graminicola]